MVILALMVAGVVAVGAAITRWFDHLPKHDNDWSEH